MLKGRIAGLLISLVLLCGCAAGAKAPMEDALAFRARVQGAEGCAFLAEVTADYGSEVYTFTLACDTDETGTLRFTVTAPETIAGICGNVAGETGNLTFDDTVLAFDAMAGEQISPVAAAYTAAQSWRTGYIRTCGRDQEKLSMSVETSFRENPLVVETWLDPEKGIPFSAEICYNGRRILSVAITDFHYNNEAE